MVDWWGLLWSASANATQIHRLDAATQAWQETATVVDERSNARGDALWDAKDGKLYVVSGTTVDRSGARHLPRRRWLQGRHSFTVQLRRVDEDLLTRRRFPRHPSQREYGIYYGGQRLRRKALGHLHVVSADKGNLVYVNHSMTSDTDGGLRSSYRQQTRRCTTTISPQSRRSRATRWESCGATSGGA